MSLRDRIALLVAEAIGRKPAEMGAIAWGVDLADRILVEVEADRHARLGDQTLEHLRPTEPLPEGGMAQRAADHLVKQGEAI